ncbi:MAG: D-alanine--poly(phosphoribitol) ligase subunit 1 [Chthoniobacter sp.]|jgi:D-alanine--poly(phosphoribitol) ligase subunit 1|nr:D-alanine--poly(phosphoribitol) ligase subunit 1 [Chthoniobacter sp.]
MEILAQIDRWGRETPDQLAHRSGDRTLTYGELLARSDSLAGWLEAEFGDNRAPIAVRGHKEPEMLIAFLGAVKSGRPYVPIDTAIPEQRALRIEQTAGAPLVLTPHRVDVLSKEARPAPARRVSGNDPFYILFTSGSTGEPKGVIITHANLTSFVEWMLGEQHLVEGGETFLNQAPFSFDLSVMDLYLSLVTGGTLFSISKDDIANLKNLYEAFPRSNLTTWVSTPSFAQMCLIERKFNQEMIPTLRRFLFCGETLAPETASQLIERFPQAEVWNTYGPTEATVATTSVRVDRAVLEKWSPLPVGYEMPGTRVLILDENRQRLPSGERGEIVIAGPNVSPGYLGREDLTSRAFQPFEEGPAYRTGDWGREREGLIFFEGRMDSQVKVNGYRIELGDLEANLRALPEIADAVVLPVEKGGRIESLAAFVVLAGERTGSDFEVSARLKTRLAERLPAYMVPRKFHFLETFPMTANGKADRRKLAELIAAK